jgi:hypothetical protein
MAAGAWRTRAPPVLTEEAGPYPNALAAEIRI